MNIDEKNIFNFSYNDVDLIYASHLISYFDYQQLLIYLHIGNQN